MLDEMIPRRQMKSVPPLNNNLRDVFMNQMKNRNCGRDKKNALEKFEYSDQSQQARSARSGRLIEPWKRIG
jgi:hypothetical protein